MTCIQRCSTGGGGDPGEYTDDEGDDSWFDGWGDFWGGWDYFLTKSTSPEFDIMKPCGEITEPTGIVLIST